MAPVVAVVVVHDVTDQLAELVGQLVAGEVPTVVVHNGVETLPVAVTRDRTNVAVLRGHGNVGYGTAANLGARRASERWRPQWILLLNSDVECDRGLGPTVRDVAEDTEPSVVVVSLPIVGSDGDIAHPATPGAGTRAEIRRLLGVRRHGIDHPRGAALLIREEWFSRFGGFDPKFFLYFEEADMIDRLGREGRRWKWAPSAAAVRHVGYVSTSSHAAASAFELGRSAALYSRRLSWTRRASWLTIRLLGVAVAGVVGRLRGRRSALAIARSHCAGMVSGLHRLDAPPKARAALSIVPYAERARLSAESAPTAARTH